MQEPEGTSACRNSAHDRIATPAAPGARPQILVLGIGNALLSDDGAGLHLLERLARDAGTQAHVSFVDGGTVGLALAPLIEDADAVIVLDAMRLGQAAGSVHVHVGAAMDAVVARPCGTPHEISLGDVFSAVRLQGRLPARRAIVGIEPASIEWGMTPTPRVAASLETAAQRVRELLAQWQRDDALAAQEVDA